MQDIRVTIVQANQIWEDKNANFSNYEELLQGVETELILLPEMFQTGFSMNAETLAENWDSSVSIEWLKKMAMRLNAAIYTSLIIEDGGIFNRGVFVEPNGSIHKYDKRKSFKLAGEHLTYSCGNQEVILNYLDWKFQLQICYDLRFPEIARNRIEKDGNIAYDALLYVANWPEKRAEHWKSLLQARAIENQSYVCGANRVGTDANDFSYSGDSRCVDALGNVHALEPFKEMIQTFVLKKNDLIKIREMLPFLSDQ